MTSVLKIVVAAMILALTALTPAHADPKAVMGNILNDAIVQIQDTLRSMDQGCGGGSNGRPPVNWPSRRVHGDNAVHLLGRAGVALANDDIGAAKEQIAAGVHEWDTLIDRLHTSCSGGSNGKHPLNYGRYVSFRDKIKERLQTALLFI